ncbi:MAG: hypothetical protein K2R98_15125 [Gemmataceae bacterium]|nr:hypothetical protein [Gemmataceae bacterium]
MIALTYRYSWGGPLEPWEIHPALNHFPIAFLLAGVALDLYAGWRAKAHLMPTATGLLVAGVLTGWVTALAGLLAFWTVPAHTGRAHDLMYWHLGIQAASLLLFAWAAWVRWRGWSVPPSIAIRAIGLVAAVLLSVGSAVGGYIVYHGGAGVDPELLAPAVRGSHSHQPDHEGMPMDGSP